MPSRPARGRRAVPLHRTHRLPGRRAPATPPGPRAHAPAPRAPTCLRPLPAAGPPRALPPARAQGGQHLHRPGRGGTREAGRRAAGGDGAWPLGLDRPLRLPRRARGAPRDRFLPPRPARRAPPPPAGDGPGPGRDDRPHPVRAGEAVREVLIPADVRFPLERANGVQVVKTAAALAGLGVPTTLLVRRSDPRSTAEILSLYGVSGAGLVVRRFFAFHRTGAFRVPRMAFLLRAAAASLSALGRGAVVFTRDLQLADLLLRARGRARVVYESHAVESVLYEERGQVYGTGEAPRAKKALRLRRREERVCRRAAAVITTTTGIASSLREAFGPRERVAVIPNGCDLPERTPSSPATRPPVVLYAGQLYPWKGVDVLVRA